MVGTLFQGCQLLFALKPALSGVQSSSQSVYQRRERARISCHRRKRPIMTTRNVLTILCCLTLVSACNREAHQEGTLSQQAPGEWIVLFNGENLDGWRSYGEAAPNPAWIVEDGAIVLDANESTTSMAGNSSAFAPLIHGSRTR